MSINGKGGKPPVPLSYLLPGVPSLPTKKRPVRLTPLRSQVPAPVKAADQFQLPIIVKADLIAELQRDIARLRERLKGWDTYDGADVINLLADTVYVLECRKQRLHRLEKLNYQPCESLASALAGPPIIVRHPPKSLVRRIRMRVKLLIAKYRR